jgi:hypothetical protein
VALALEEHKNWKLLKKLNTRKEKCFVFVGLLLLLSLSFILAKNLN